MRASSVAALGLIVVVVLGGRVSAHRLDELLQAARIAVERNRVEIELELTPGAAVAETIIADLDRDADGAASENEKRGYAHQVLAAIELSLDGRPLHLAPITFSFPALDVLRRGEGAVQVRYAAATNAVPAGAHALLFRNAYRPELSVYLANALVPTDDGIAVTAQHRDAAQRQVTIDYVLGPASTAIPIWLVGITSIVFITTLSLRRRVEKPDRGKP